MASKLPMGRIVMMIVLSIVVLYLFGQIMPKVDYTCKDSDLDDPVTTKDESRYGCTSVGELVQRREFEVPEPVDPLIFNIVRIVIVGLALYIGYAVVTKLGRPLTRKDIMTLIVMGVAIYFLWEYVIQKVLEAPTLSDITFSVGQKLGLFKP